MGITIPPEIFKRYGLNSQTYKIQKVGSGLINHTFKLCAKDRNPEENLILQRINTQVFKEPERIARNHRTAADYLKENYPDYYFLTPVQTTNGNDMLTLGDEYWRILPFVQNAFTTDEADNPKQAYEAAKQFGRFANYLSGIELDDFQPTIPDFHNLTLRYCNFKQAVAEAPSNKKRKAKGLIRSFRQYSGIVDTYKALESNPEVPDRLMHHDTKINNVMFDAETFEGKCVIDLDTMMPGKVISDLGDMVRTYVCPVSEEETDFNKIGIRNDYYEALMNGYLSEIRSDLTSSEKDLLFYAGQFMIYMQGLRYLADYLNNDVYYGADYPLHNYNRTQNQLTLLEALNEKEKDMKHLIEKYI